MNDLMIGDVVIATFPEQHPGGHEQQGYRPAIVIGIPEHMGRPRYPVLLVVPVTTDRGQPWIVQSPKLYPRLAAGSGNLPSNSVALLDQARALDMTRLKRYLGTLSSEQYQAINNGLKGILQIT